MNSTQSGEMLECICFPSTPSIIISVIGIILPLFISEVLPFCRCEPNGIAHWISINCKRKNVVVPQNN